MRCANGFRLSGVAMVSMACVVCADSASTQQGVSTSIPQIVVSGTSEVVLPAAKAAFSLSVTTAAQSSATASEDNARISKAVSDALERAGIKREEVSASHITVSPHWDVEERDNRPKRNGYDATNTIDIQTERLSQIGLYIDAALSAGATGASQVMFSAKDTDGARRQALSQAVASARADAETIARAASGTLGELLLVSTERANESPDMGLQEVVVTAAVPVRGSVSTEVIPSQIKVSATVLAHWRFIPASAGK